MKTNDYILLTLLKIYSDIHLNQENHLGATRFIGGPLAKTNFWKGIFLVQNTSPLKKILIWPLDIVNFTLTVEIKELFSLLFRIYLHYNSISLTLTLNLTLTFSSFYLGLLAWWWWAQWVWGRTWCSPHPAGRLPPQQETDTQSQENHLKFSVSFTLCPIFLSVVLRKLDTIYETRCIPYSTNNLQL